MESRIYSVLFQFNYGIEQALAALDTLEKMDLEPREYVQQIGVRFQEVAANANSHFTDRVSKQEIRKQLECGRERRQQEEEANPDRIYLRVATAEDIRRQRGLPPSAVILPWTRLDDDRALARIKALAPAQQSAQPAPDNSTQSPPSEEGSAQAWQTQRMKS
jgi:hypothetical protein